MTTSLRMLKALLFLIRANPVAALQTLIRLKPKMVISVSMFALSASILLSGISPAIIHPYFLPAVKMLSCVALASVVYEYKRILPFRIFSKQTFLQIPKDLEKLDRRKINFKMYKNFPVCTVNVASAHERGKLIARLFAPQLVDAFDQYYSWLPTAVDAIYTRASLLKARTLPYYDPHSPLYKTNIEQFLNDEFKIIDFKFPAHMIQEFTGVAEELAIHINELNRNSLIQRPVPTLDSIKLLVALPDIVKMSPNEISVVNCTAAVRKFPGYVQHMRTLDYATLGVLTQFTALFAWLSFDSKRYEYMPLAAVSFVPFTAALSITNGYLTATINDAATTTTKRYAKGGLPETLCLRYALENCKTFAELDEHFKQHFPATTCTFVVSSPSEARVYQMLPTDDHSCHYNVVPLSGNGYLVATNHHKCSHQGSVLNSINPKSINWHTTREREDAACKALDANKPWNEVLRSVNVPETAQSMCFQYPSNISHKNLTLAVSIQNYNAAACPAHEYNVLPVGEILENLATPTLGIV